ncbi:hypothetical protein AVEN_194163-1, partial [Araneus ventricosus]
MSFLFAKLQRVPTAIRPDYFIFHKSRFRHSSLSEVHLLYSLKNTALCTGPKKCNKHTIILSSWRLGYLYLLVPMVPGTAIPPCPHGAWDSYTSLSPWRLGHIYLL